MNTKRFLSAVMAMLCFVFCNCGKDAEVESVNIRPTEVELCIGETYQMSAAVLPAAADQSVEWTSSRPSVAAVSSAGVVTALVVGECDITVFAADKSDICHVVVVENSVNPNMGITEDGAVDALFSVGEGRKVCFSRGNLQYRASTNTWRFAECQPEYIGGPNSSISQFYAGWIDLFGWGTSGWPGGTDAYKPYSTSVANAAYYVGGAFDNNLEGPYANADWGVYNAVQNGGNQAGVWRTLSKDEWGYLLESRPDAAHKCGLATIGSTSGLVLLPDSWVLPASCSFVPGCENGYYENVYTAMQWIEMQTNGAVFLPAAGTRYGTMVSGEGSNGYYWSSSYVYEDDSYIYESNAYSLTFGGDYVFVRYGMGRYAGNSVRLVRDK